MFERVYQEKRVFVRTFRCKYLPECSNEKWASPECLASGSDIYSVSTKYRTDELPLHREANKPQLAVVDTPSVRRLRETFEDSCKKCSNLRVMYHCCEHVRHLRLNPTRNSLACRQREHLQAILRKERADLSGSRPKPLGKPSRNVILEDAVLEEPFQPARVAQVLAFIRQRERAPQQGVARHKGHSGDAAWAKHACKLSGGARPIGRIGQMIERPQALQPRQSSHQASGSDRRHPPRQSLPPADQHLRLRSECGQS